MRKKRPTRRRTQSQQVQPGAPEGVSEKVLKGIEHIRWCYSTGVQFLQYPSNKSGRRSISALAKEKNIPEMEARRYAQFALGYTLQELEELIAVFLAENIVFSFTHFRILLGIKDKPMRAELALRAIRERLGVVRTRRLKDRLVRNPASQGGRKSQLLEMEKVELEWTLNQNIDKLHRELQQVLSHPCEIEPDFRKRLEQLARHLS